MQPTRETSQEHKLIEIKILQIDQVFVNTLKGKLKSPFKEAVKLGDDYLMLKPILKAGDGNREKSEFASHETHQELESQRM